MDGSICLHTQVIVQEKVYIDGKQERMTGKNPSARAGNEDDEDGWRLRELNDEGQYKMR